MKHYLLYAGNVCARVCRHKTVAETLAKLNNYKIVEKQTKNIPMIINIKSVHPSASLYARLIWEKLFRTVQAEKFDTLGDFLCDLNIMKELIEQNNLPFYWYSDGSGYTDLTTYRPLNRTGETVYKINRTSDEIIITPEDL